MGWLTFRKQEVDNNLWFLEHAQSENYLARVQTLSGSFAREGSENTI